MTYDWARVWYGAAGFVFVVFMGDDRLGWMATSRFLLSLLDVVDYHQRELILLS